MSTQTDDQTLIIEKDGVSLNSIQFTGRVVVYEYWEYTKSKVELSVTTVITCRALPGITTWSPQIKIHRTV